MDCVRFANLIREYEDLFDRCEIRTGWLAAFDKVVTRILRNRQEYTEVQAEIGVPWYFVAVIHNMEASGSFKRHLHNGDSLRQRTYRVPAGRPKEGEPPFTWKESAIDALMMKGLHKETDWSIARMLWQLERYNGWGYRKYHGWVKSPYLWSGSYIYDRGKYVADGRWSDTAISKQLGAAVILKRLVQRGELKFPSDKVDVMLRPVKKKTPLNQTLLRFAKGKHPGAAKLQRFLNQFPGVHLHVDGCPGPRTSSAFKQLTGYFLRGDPRLWRKK